MLREKRPERIRNCAASENSMPTESQSMARHRFSILPLLSICSVLWICLLLAQQSFALGQNGSSTTGFYFVTDKNVAGMGTLDFPVQPFNTSNITFPGQGVSNAASFAAAGISLCLTPPIPVNGTQNLDAAGRSLYYQPIRLRNATTNSLLSFSTMFNFWIQTSTSLYTAGDGLAFIMAPDNVTTGGVGKYLGWLNNSTNSDPSAHNFAVEFDIFQDPEFLDVDNNHVGVNINNMTSTFNQTAGFYPHNGSQEFSLINMTDDTTIYAWIEYDAPTQVLNVTINVNDNAKPWKPLISEKVNLTSVLNEFMYVGFTAATGDDHMAQHTVYAWSFSTSEEAVNVFGNTTTEPGHHHKSNNVMIVIVCASVATVVGLLVVFLIVIAFYCRSKRKIQESGDRWSHELGDLDPKKYGPHEFSYRDLSDATQKFSEKEKLGRGGFGWVYKGVMPNHTEVAVKRISEKSEQGSREFMAEVEIIGRMRHRNLVRLLGWCHDKGELLLVYEYMPKGSLDNIIYRQEVATPKVILSWEQKKNILCGVATALHFLHEEYVQCVLHRDVKASNVMLDADYNARLGDFGMARSHEHSEEPKITRLAGTIGYIAPELLLEGQASQKTDVYSFGVLSLEIITGRRATGKFPDGKALVDWVWSLFSSGNIMAAADISLNYDEKEMPSLALRTGLLCCHPDPDTRPTMGQTLSYLKGAAPFPMQLLPEHKPLPKFAYSSEHSAVDQVLGGTTTYFTANDTTHLSIAHPLHINDEPCLSAP